MKTLNLKNGLLLLSLLASLACQKKQDIAIDDESVDSTAAIAESAVTLISGIADEQTNSSFASLPRSQAPSWAQLLIEQAHASSCLRAVVANCDSGVRSQTYSDCELPNRQVQINGQVSLSYSNSLCSMANTGDSVIRTAETEISGPRGGVITNSSSTKADYRGANSSYGGGGKITKTDAGFDLEILGRHSSMSYQGRKVYDVSIRTLQPISIQGGLSRAQRTAQGGQLEINHNQRGYTAVWSFSNVQWSNSCCHPVSGTVQIEFSGSRTGQSTLSFEGCGSGVVTEDGQSKPVEFSYCE